MEKKKMEVQIISREVVKPSAPKTVQHQKPYKLCILSQLTPTTYFPIIFFYTMNGSIETERAISRMKTSLSDTLNLYYPLSGRTKDNVFYDQFNEGVPFIDATVNCSMSQFLKCQEREGFLNWLLPCRPFTKETDIKVPAMVIQVSRFTCGGIALGFCGSHKLIDGFTAKAFFTTWGAISCGESDKIVHPELDEASSYFPPIESPNEFPQNHLDLVESLWFTEANYVTKRFLFDAKAISTLKEKATRGTEQDNGDRNMNRISRIKALTCFVWKCYMSASKVIDPFTPKTSILAQTVNLRSRTKPTQMSESSIGDIFWWAIAVADPKDSNADLPELANLVAEATELYDQPDYIQTLQGSAGTESIGEHFDQVEGLLSSEKPDFLAFTSWLDLGFTKVDFGWGQPYWVALMSKPGPTFRDLTVFIETRDGEGIEAWITLDQQRMSVLERDPEFLSFASPSSHMVSKL